MSGQNEATIKLPKNVSVHVGGKVYRGECPDRLLASEHKLRNTVEKKKPSAGKSGDKSA